METSGCPSNRKRVCIACVGTASSADGSSYQELISELSGARTSPLPRASLLVSLIGFRWNSNPISGSLNALGHPNKKPLCFFLMVPELFPQKLKLVTLLWYLFVLARIQSFALVFCMLVPYLLLKQSCCFSGHPLLASSHLQWHTRTLTTDPESFVTIGHSIKH